MIILNNITNFLMYFISFAKGFSQVYILITCIPEIISFIKHILLSVILAVFNRVRDIFFPNQSENKTNSLLINIM